MTGDMHDCAGARSSVRLLIRAGKGARALVERDLRSVELNFAQWMLLRLIRDEVAVTPGALAAALEMNTSGITRLIDGLEKRGLLCRERSTADRRMVSVQLTEDGVRKLDDVMPNGMTACRDVFSEFAPAEVELFQSLLGRLVGSIEARGGFPDSESVASRKTFVDARGTRPSD